MRFKRAFNKVGLPAGIGNAGTGLFRLAVPVQQIVEALLQGHAAIMHGALVGIDDEEGQAAQAIRLMHGHGPRPVHMQQHPLGNQGIVRFGHDPARAQDGMAAAVPDAVGLGQIMEQGGGPHRGHMHGTSRRRGPARQFRGDVRHQQRMRPHVVEHLVFVPEGEAGLVIGNVRVVGMGRQRGMPGKRRFGKGIQRMPATDVFRLDGMGWEYGAHSRTMPPSPSQGKAGNCNLPVHAP